VLEAGLPVRRFVQLAGARRAAETVARAATLEESSMNDIGFAVPIWILGAPFFLMILDWARTPRGGR
jgi:hypothetical protein